RGQVRGLQWQDPDLEQRHRPAARLQESSPTFHATMILSRSSNRRRGSRPAASRRRVYTATVSGILARSSASLIVSLRPTSVARVFLAEVRPGHLGEDPGFLGSVTDRFERVERLPVEVEGARQVTAAGCQLGEAAERQAGSFLVADSLLDLERPGVLHLGGVEVARDGVEDSVDARGKPFAPDEAEGAT